MTHISKDHHQFALGSRDTATVGRLGGGFQVPAIGWAPYMYGLGFYGGGSHGGSNTGSTSNQGTDNDDTASGNESTGGESGDGSGSM